MISTSESRSTDLFTGKVKSEACGKAILVGEHAVVYGAKAVALPLKDMRLQIEGVRNHSDRNDDINLFIDGHRMQGDVLKLVYKAFEVLNIKPFPFDGYAKSTLPIGAGLGSSATLCIAILKCLSQVMKKELSPTLLAKLGNNLERLFHGTPSGLDASVVAFESPILFSKEAGPKPVEIASAPWTFAIIDSGMKSSTQAMIDKARPFFQGENSEHIIERFNQLADLTLISLKEKDSSLMAHVMDEAHALLDQAGVVPERLRDVVKTTKDLGALSTKITGAGGGGALISLLDPKKVSEQKVLIKEKLSHLNVYFTSI